MMGDETLAEVRARLAAAMAGPQGVRPSSTGRSEVVEALERFLAGPAAEVGEPAAPPRAGRGHGKKARRISRRR